MSLFERISENDKLQYISNGILYGFSSLDFDTRSFTEKEKESWDRLQSLIDDSLDDDFDL